MAQLPALRAFLPAGVSLDVASDRSPTIRATLREAQHTLLIAVAPGHLRRAALPGQLPRGADPGDGRAGGADRQLRGDVPVGLLAQQPVAHGADRRHRTRGRRRHRRAREHLAACGGGHAADRRRAEGRRGGGLHAAVDEPVAGGGVRLDPLHGRDRRAPVPRVLDHARRGHPDLAGRVADAHAHALRALAPGARRETGPPAGGQRRGIRLASARLRTDRSTSRSITRRSC